MTNCDLKIQLK